MKQHDQSILARLPSLRALFIFDAAARHLNLVRAAEELGLTQGALSRQIKQLEEHLGAELFVRLPRGLDLTEAGDILRNHCLLGFRELREGVSLISGVRTRQSLRIAAARSFATRILSRRVSSFVNRYPWIDLIVDGHRFLVDLARNEADAAIRVGDGRWPDVTGEKIEDDPLFPIASPDLVAQEGTTDIGALAEKVPLLHYMERPYWELWTQASNIKIRGHHRNVRFSETVMMIEAAEAGQGIAIARRSLVREALARGELVQLSPIEADDGIGYFFCATPEALRRETVKKFREWIFSIQSEERADPVLDQA